MNLAQEFGCKDYVYTRKRLVIIQDFYAQVSQDGVREDSDATARSSSEFEDMEDIEVEKGFKMSRVCDRLIDVFLVERTNPEDWRILITLSQEWGKIRPYFFTRCESQAKLAEDQKKKADLLKLARQMKEVLNQILKGAHLTGPGFSVCIEVKPCNSGL